MFDQLMNSRFEDFDKIPTLLQKIVEMTNKKLMYWCLI